MPDLVIILVLHSMVQFPAMASAASKPPPSTVAKAAGGDLSRRSAAPSRSSSTPLCSTSGPHRGRGAPAPRTLEEQQAVLGGQARGLLETLGGLREVWPRVRSHCRFRDRGTEYGNKSGIKWMSGGTKRQCDRALRSATTAPLQQHSSATQFGGTIQQHNPAAHATGHAGHPAVSEDDRARGEPGVAGDLRARPATFLTG